MKKKKKTVEDDTSPSKDNVNKIFYNYVRITKLVSTNFLDTAMLVDTALSGLRQTDPRCCIFLFCNPPIQKRHLPRCSKAGNLHKSKVSNHDYLYPVFSQLIQDMYAGLEYSSVKIGYWYILPWIQGLSKVFLTFRISPKTTLSYF